MSVVHEETISTCVFNPTSALKFFRLEASGVLYSSNQYTRAQKSNNYSVVYIEQGTHTKRFGFTEYFIELHNTREYAAFAVIKTVEVEKLVRADIALSHLFCVKEYTVSTVIPITWITSKCLFVQVSSSAFVAEPPCECVRLSC